MAKRAKDAEVEVAPGTLRVEYVPLGEVVPATANPKAHDLAGIRESVVRFGFGDPMALDERTGRLLEGHGRREVLLALLGEGAEPPRGVRKAADGAWLVPVVRGFSTSDDAEAAAYLVAHNRLTERGGWDDKALYGSLKAIADAGRGFAGVGFGEADLERLRSFGEALPPVEVERADGERGRTAPEYLETWEATQLRQVTLIMPAPE